MTCKSIHLHCHFSHAMTPCLRLSCVCVRKRTWKRKRWSRAASQRRHPPGWGRNCYHRFVYEAGRRRGGTGGAEAASHRAVETASCLESCSTHTQKKAGKWESSVITHLIGVTEYYLFTTCLFIVCALINLLTCAYCSSVIYFLFSINTFLSGTWGWEGWGSAAIPIGCQ